MIAIQQAEAQLASLWLDFPVAAESLLRTADPVRPPHQVEVHLAEAANNLLTVISGEAARGAERWAQSVYDRTRDLHPVAISVASAQGVFRSGGPTWVRPENFPSEWIDLAAALTVYLPGFERMTLQDFLVRNIDEAVFIPRENGLRGTANPIFRTAVIRTREAESPDVSALEILSLLAHEAAHNYLFWEVIGRDPKAAVAVTLQERNAFLLESLILQEGIRLLDSRHLLDSAAEMRLVDQADMLMEGALACNRILGYPEGDQSYRTDLRVPLEQAQGYPPTMRPIGKLPPHVQISFRTAETASQEPIHPSEEALLSPGVSSRRRSDFAMGRAAARDVLRRLLSGETPPILQGSLGEPLWPEGVVASLSHTDDIAVAIAARRDKSLSLGVDIERLDVGMKLKLAQKICTPGEMEWVMAGRSESLAESRAESEERLRLVWCAKEALYKALFPLTSQVRGFHDAAVTLNQQRANRWEFDAELQKDWENGFHQGYRAKVYARIIGHHLLAWVEIPKG